MEAWAGMLAEPRQYRQHSRPIIAVIKKSKGTLRDPRPQTGKVRQRSVCESLKSLRLLHFSEQAEKIVLRRNDQRIRDAVLAEAAMIDLGPSNLVAITDLRIAVGFQL